MFNFNLMKCLCFNDTIIFKSATLFVINECFLQFVLLIPISIIFLTVNSYQYGCNKQLSRHITSIQLKIYRLLATLLTISLAIKLIITYFVYDIDYEISSIVLINDLLQLISSLFHLNLLFNKSIFKNLDFRKYPIGLTCTSILLLLAHLVTFLNQLLKYIYFTQSYNQLVLTHLILNGFYCSISLIYVLFILLFYKLKVRSQAQARNLVSEEDKANYISYLTFDWLQNVMSKGYKQELNSIDDLSQLPDDLNINSVCKHFMSKYTDQDIDLNPIINPDILQSNNGNLGSQVIKQRLIKTLIKCYGREFLIIGIFKLFNDSLNFVGPLLLFRLVQYIELNSQDVKLGCMYAAGLFFWSMFMTLFSIWYNYRFGKLCFKIKCALIDLIYTKTVQIELNELNKYSIGEIVNFMSVDCDTISNIFPCIHEAWSLPFQISITFYLLYQLIGLSFLVGIGFVIVVTPINKVLSHYIAKLHQQFLECKDSRVKV